MSNIYLDASVKNLPYEKVFDNEVCLLKESSDWFKYEGGQKTDRLLGKRYRVFYPALERSLWLKIENRISLRYDKIPSTGISIKPIGLKVTMYGTTKGGIEFAATADDIEPATADEDLLG